jgi:hexosaminidase
MSRFVNRAAILATTCAALIFGSAVYAEPSIIPLPVEMKGSKGEFKITPDTRIVAEGKATAEAVKLIDTLAPAMGYRLQLAELHGAKNTITLSLDASLDKKLGEEGYTLNATARRIELRAAAPAGLFYGIQTLRQLLPPDVYRNAPVENVEWTVPCVRITDYPRFEWRGLLIDPARHFIPKRDMMRYIDAMALHKFNRLQIHFTDGQGWRIEIKKYPLLTEVGSRWHNTIEQRDDKGLIYGGYYTQEDIRELVRYGAERYVMLVPEIEMPYHAGAAIVAYPKLGFDLEKLAALPPEQRRHQAGNLVVPRPYTVAFMKDVLDEVIEMFPGAYIHIGGDEASTDRWAKLPEMREQMKKLKLADVHELHSWFIKQMDAHLARRGRKMVGWDEILQGGLAKDATVMSWRGTGGGITAAQAGHDVIMAPTSHTYFDYRQIQDKTSEPGGFGSAVITLEKVYTFEPVPRELNAEQAAHILGGQGQLWGERIPNERHREYQTYPRASALIETIWSPRENRNYERFHQRLEVHTKRLNAADIYYRQLDPRP